MMKDDSDLLLIQTRLVNRMMELYDSTQDERNTIKRGKDQNLRGIIDGVYSQINPLMEAMRGQDDALADIEREARRKYYEQLASIVVEMIPLLADAIAIRLRG